MEPVEPVLTAPLLVICSHRISDWYNKNGSFLFAQFMQAILQKDHTRRGLVSMRSALWFVPCNVEVAQISTL